MTEWQQESQKNTERKYLGRRKGDYKFTIPQEAELESDVKSSERGGLKNEDKQQDNYCEND